MENGTVTVDMINLLMKHSTQFLKLGEIHQTNQHVPVSIRESLSLRRSELEAFLKLREDMACFLNFSTIFTLGMSIVMLDFICMNLFASCKYVLQVVSRDVVVKNQSLRIPDEIKRTDNLKVGKYTR